MNLAMLVAVSEEWVVRIQFAASILFIMAYFINSLTEEILPLFGHTLTWFAVITLQTWLTFSSFSAQWLSSIARNLLMIVGEKFTFSLLHTRYDSPYSLDHHTHQECSQEILSPAFHNNYPDW
jgi:hypothetical protein